MPTIRLRPTELRPLRPVQEESLVKMLPLDFPAFVMEMRLGKTTAAIRWAVQKGLSGPILVLAPLTVLEAWEGELFAEGERFSTLHGLTPDERFNALEWAWNLGRRHWVLVTYGTTRAEGEVWTRVSKTKTVWRTMTVTDPETGEEVEERVEIPKETRVRELPDIAFLPWEAVLLDESTEIRNPGSQISKVCTLGFRFAKHRVLLTGLINPESDLDVFQQFKYLHGHFMGFSNFWEWRTHCFRKFGFEWVHKPGMKQRIKEEVHRLAFVMTVKQAGLPCEITFQTRYFDMTVKQRRLYAKALNDYALLLESGEEKETSWKLVQRAWLLRISGGFSPEGALLNSALADEVLRLLKGQLAGRKLVVWFSLRGELEYVAQRLTKARITHVCVTGDDLSREARKAKLEAFRGRGARVLLCMETCAKFGVDCSAADTAIYYSNEPSNEARQQSLKRIQRYEAGRSHLIIDFATRGTLSEAVVKLVRGKGLRSKLFMQRLDYAILQAAQVQGSRLRDSQESTSPGVARRPQSLPIKPYVAGKPSAQNTRVESAGRPEVGRLVSGTKLRLGTREPRRPVIIPFKAR